MALWNIQKCEAYRKENHKINKDVYYDNKHMKETIINKISSKSKPQPLPDLKNGLKTKPESLNKEEFFLACRNVALAQIGRPLSNILANNINNNIASVPENFYYNWMDVSNE